MSKKNNTFRLVQALPLPCPLSSGEDCVTLKAFIPFPKRLLNSRCLLSKSSLKWEGKVVRGGGGQVQTNAVGRSIMKHTNTQLCVDSLPLFSPSRHNRPLIPLRSAHGGQTVPVQQRQPHLVEPNSGIIWDYGRRRIEQRACWIPHCTDVTRLRLRKAELL